MQNSKKPRVHAPSHCVGVDVRFGSQADMAVCAIDVRFTPRKRTCAVQLRTSALCQKQTWDYIEATPMIAPKGILFRVVR